MLQFLQQAVLDLELTPADGVRLYKRCKWARKQLLVFMSDREVPPPNNVLEQALRLSTVLHKVTNGFRVEWGAELPGSVPSVQVTLRTTLEIRSIQLSPSAPAPE